MGHAGTLGRIPPPDWKHVDKYPLTAETAPKEKVPGAIGINWYSNFDEPERDEKGHYWIGRNPNNLGHVRGGHCIAVRKRGSEDPNSWWRFYDQDDPEFVVRIRSEYPWKPGGCTGFGTARMLSHFNRKRYDPYFLYAGAQERDPWPGTDYEGATVRAAFDVARELGARRISRGRAMHEDAGEGIAANRWATNVEDFADAVGYLDVGYLTLLNSWGSGYPHMARMPLETAAVLLAEDGEFGLPVDR
jgi:hypothetical protein